MQELAFTLANGIAYCEAARRGGALARRVRRAAVVLLQRAQRLLPGGGEVPRGAAAVGAGAWRERFGATNPKALALRFHAQTGGSTLTAQQPENNIVRVAIQALVGGLRRRAVAAHELVRRGARAAVASARRAIALRTQQVLAAEAGDDRHRRPARRLVLRRGADRRARGARVGADRARSTSSAARSPRSRPAGSRARSRRPRTLDGRGRGRRADDRRRERVRRGRTARTDRAAPARPGGRAAPGRADARACAPGATRPRPSARSRAVREAARGTENLLPPIREALAAHVHGRRGLRRAARGVGHVRPRLSARSGRVGRDVSRV